MRTSLLLLLPALLAGVARADGPPEPLTLDWCLDRAADVNPTLERESALRDAAAERIDPAGALEDPRFGYEASNLPIHRFDFVSTPLSGHQFGLRQKLPFPGLLSNRRAAAKAGATAAKRALADREVSIAAMVEIAWAELGFAQRALEITERNIALLRQLAQVAEAKYRVGTGLQQDVLRAQVELTVLLDEQLGRRAAIEGADARLGALLDLPADVRFARTESLGDASVVPPLDGLVGALEERNARLGALAARVEEARHQVRAAELEGYPDFDLGLGYRLRRAVPDDPVEGDDFLSAGVTIRLPVDRSRWNAHVAERRALLRRAEAEYREARAALFAELRIAHAGLSRADAEVALLETGLVPQAGQSLQSSRSGYEVGRLEFLGLLDSQVRLQNAELRLARARADRRQAFSALEAAVGETIR